MKRTLEQSRTFFKRDTANRGFGRELYKTPKEIIFLIIRDLLNRCPWLRDYTFIDPCAGDGRWQEVAERFGLRCRSYDIEPLSPFVAKQDFYTLTLPEGRYFICGNPPFSELQKFVDKALSLCPSCYFLGGSQIITGKLSPDVRWLHRFEGWEGNQKDKRSKIKFIDTNGKEVLVWCCGALFSRMGLKPFERSDIMKEGYFRTSVKSYTKETDRVVPISIVEAKSIDFLK